MTVENRFAIRDRLPEWYKRMCKFFGWDQTKAHDVKKCCNRK
jgi:hypothetical protein